MAMVPPVRRMEAASAACGCARPSLCRMWPSVASAACAEGGVGQIALDEGEAIGEPKRATVLRVTGITPGQSTAVTRTWAERCACAMPHTPEPAARSSTRAVAPAQ